MSIGSPSFEDVKLEDFERTIAVNLVAPFNIIKHAFLQMKSQSPQGGRIINNGSISAVTPRPGSAAYTSSKHAITGLTKVGLSLGSPTFTNCLLWRYPMTALPGLYRPLPWTAGNTTLQSRRSISVCLARAFRAADSVFCSDQI